MSALAVLRHIAAQYAALDDADVEEWLAMARAQMAPATTWGAVYEQAVANRAAHMMTRARVGEGAEAGDPTTAAPGSLASVTTARLSVSYGASGGPGSGRASSGGDDELTTTRYGLAYLELRASRAARLPRMMRRRGW